MHTASRQFLLTHSPFAFAHTVLLFLTNYMSYEKLKLRGLRKLARSLRAACCCAMDYCLLACSASAGLLTCLLLNAGNHEWIIGMKGRAFY
jgi:hypothetical protein